MLQGTHKQFGLKLDRQSDMIENALGGLCKECMVLRAKIDITDEEGNKLGRTKSTSITLLPWI
jgi:hypothetical protein